VAAIVANGLRLRRRARALVCLDDDAPGVLDPGYAFLVAEGVTLDAATRRAAIGHARAHDLDVVDLVPADLPVAQVLELLGMVDPSSFRSDPLAPGRGAYQATLVDRLVLERAGIEASESLDPVTYVRHMTTLKQFAPRTTDLAVAPSLSAGDEPLEKRRAQLDAIAGDASPLLIGGPLARHLALAAGPVLSPLWGSLAVLAHLALARLVVDGTALVPRDRGLTLWRALRRDVATMRGGWQAPTETAGPSPDDPALRATYDGLLADGIDRFFEPRRDDCPLCGAASLHPRVEVPDLLQAKPGRFVLDECRGCGHVFQNPRLTVEGLEFYYRDFYDGLGTQQMDALFSLGVGSYQGRIDMVARTTAPKRWLDVGCGHGHFCLTAAGAFPETRFDGLDLSAGLDEAARRGWVEHGHKGLFPEVAPTIVGSYDMVSMHHYLEHTVAPRDELAAAHTVLEPGGHLLIEVPDPESRFARWLGPYWGVWLQPQHLHFLSVANLCAELIRTGFTVVDIERGPAHGAGDLTFACWLACNRLAPPAPAPWLPPTTAGQRAAHLAVFVAAAPVLAVTLVVDGLMAPLLRRVRGGTNAYRVLARRNDH
jgi:SAM-dependent methyltransferase